MRDVWSHGEAGVEVCELVAQQPVSSLPFSLTHLALERLCRHPAETFTTLIAPRRCHESPTVLIPTEQLTCGEELLTLFFAAARAPTAHEAANGERRISVQKVVLLLTQASFTTRRNDRTVPLVLATA